MSEEDLYKLALMLQNALNGGAEQLERIGLAEWLDIARKQKWSENATLLHKYGSVGYYLGLLESKGFVNEQRRIQAIIDRATVVPEKLIALLTQWIITRVIDTDVELNKQLRLAVFIVVFILSSLHSTKFVVS